MFGKRLVTLLVLLAFSGCTTTQMQVALVVAALPVGYGVAAFTDKVLGLKSPRQRAIKKLESLMNPLVGRTTETVVLRLGTPVQTHSVGGLVVYKYYWEYGTGGGLIILPSDTFGMAYGQSWKKYDSVDVYFRNGVMVGWKGYVQR